MHSITANASSSPLPKRLGNSDGIYPHPHGTEVPGNRQCHPDHAALGSGVGGLANLAVKGCGGRHVDDGTAAAIFVQRLGLGHGCCGTAQYIEGADQVDLDHEGKFVQIKRLVTPVDGAPGSAKAGRVDTGAQGAELAGGGNRGIRIFSTGDIALDEYAANLFGNLFAPFFIEIGNDDF
jgi:hypothetical protein